MEARERYPGSRKNRSREEKGKEKGEKKMDAEVARALVAASRRWNGPGGGEDAERSERERRKERFVKGLQLPARL